MVFNNPKNLCSHALSRSAFKNKTRVQLKTEMQSSGRNSFGRKNIYIYSQNVIKDIERNTFKKEASSIS